MSRRRLLLGPAAAALMLGGCGTSSSGGVTWDVTAQSAMIDKRNEMGACWESDCSAPLTYACATLGGARRCSTALASTMPQWFDVLVPGATSDALRSGITVDYMHGSGGAGDPMICQKNVSLNDTVFAAGHFDLLCGGTTVLTLGLRAN